MEKYDQYKNHEWLSNKYCEEKMSVRQIAKLIGADHATVSKWLKSFGIKVKSKEESSSLALKGKKISKTFVNKRVREKHWNWKGGKIKDSQGYIRVKSESHPHKNNLGYVHEHRLMLEKKLGRYLEPTEVVHHINEIKNDNRIENLFLFHSESDHRHFHHQVKKNSRFKMKYQY